MAARLDPTFHATAKLAMEAAPETYAYTLMLSPDFSQPDGLGVVDLVPRHSGFDRLSLPRIQLGQGGAIEQHRDTARDARLA